MDLEIVHGKSKNGEMNGCSGQSPFGIGFPRSLFKLQRFPDANVCWPAPNQRRHFGLQWPDNAVSVQGTKQNRRR